MYNSGSAPAPSPYNRLNLYFGGVCVCARCGMLPPSLMQAPTDLHATFVSPSLAGGLTVLPWPPSPSRVFLLSTVRVARSLHCVDVPWFPNALSHELAHQPLMSIRTGSRILLVTGHPSLAPGITSAPPCLDLPLVFPCDARTACLPLPRDVQLHMSSINAARSQRLGQANSSRQTEFIAFGESYSTHSFMRLWGFLLVSWSGRQSIHPCCPFKHNLPL